ncbi:serine hydrolase domain-containing protein [Singulisphaera acidiphila]|nr:serine hydrolase domain-containing protein [Singulisphaera acidiphila]
MKNSTLRKGGDVPTPRAGNSQVSPTRKVWSVAMRTITITAAILFCLMSATLPAQSPPTSSPPEQVQAVTALPETPAGKQFAAWLAAVNTGRRETLRQFISENYAPPPNGSLPVDQITDRQFKSFNDTGGFDVRKIAASSPEKIAVVVQAKRTEKWMVIGMTVGAQSPHNILGMGFRNTEAPADLLPRDKLTDQEIRDKVDGFLTKLVEADAFSGVVLIAKDGRPIYQRASGLASRTWNAPNRIDTKFNIASIGKMFTAVAIAQLVEKGKLSYEDTLGTILPDYPNKDWAQKVTVHHLLTHTSGLAENHPSGDKPFRQGFRTVKEYLSSSSAHDTLKFEPGSRLEYSSYGYLVLGAIIEKASGQDYYDYVREHIYQPADMTDSDCYDLDTDPPNLATGYMDAPNRTRRSNIFMLPVKGLPYGLGYSTAEDLVKFAQALGSQKLLDAKSTDLIWTGQVDYTEPDSRYGYGFIVKRYNGTRIIGHGGGWVGITNKFEMYPDLGYTVVILSNIDSDPNSIASKLREWLTQGLSRE